MITVIFIIMFYHDYDYPEWLLVLVLLLFV